MTSMGFKFLEDKKLYVTDQRLVSQNCCFTSESNFRDNVCLTFHMIELKFENVIAKEPVFVENIQLQSMFIYVLEQFAMTHSQSISKSK